jgi:hypothetical protein
MANSKISALTAATTPVAGTEVLPIVQSSATVKLAISDLTPGLSTITAAKGGTGQTTYAVGDLLYASAATTLSKLADVATGNALISGGVTTAPSWGKIGLTTHVSGILPVANGGTNASTASITSFNNITGYTASGATGTTSTNLVFSTSPNITTPTLIGDVSLSTGDITQGTAAKGVNFTANTPATGMTSQLLNWYEQGTWTPSLTFGGSNIGMTGTFSGSYTRIGNLVYAVFKIVLTANGISVGGALISGLPFPVGLGYGMNTTIDPITGMVGLLVGGSIFAVPNASVIYPMVQTATARTQITNTNFSSTSQISGAVLYTV